MKKARVRTWMAQAMPGVICLHLLAALPAFAQSDVRTHFRLGIQTHDVRQVSAQDFRNVVAIARSGRTICTGTYVGRGAILTAAGCACGLPIGSRTDPAQIVFSSYAVRFTVTGVTAYDPSSCDAANGLGSAHRGIAIVHFWERETQATGNVEFASYFRRDDRAANSDNVVAPMRIAAPSSYLSPDVDTFYLVGFSGADGSPANQKVVALGRIADKLCSKQSGSAAGCQAGVKALVTDLGQISPPCQSGEGGPGFVWVSSDYALAAVATGVIFFFNGSAATEIYTLVTPDVVRWLVGKVGIEVTVCFGPNRCVWQQSAF